MSVVFSGSLSGSFVSTGVAKLIELQTGYDRIETFNRTQWDAAGAGQAVQCSWQAPDPDGGGQQLVKEATIGALVPSYIAASAGFWSYNGTNQVPGPLIASTATGVTADTPPRVMTSADPRSYGLVTGDTVRMFTVTGGTQLNAYDFTVTVPAMVTTYFQLSYMPPIVATNAACAFRKIPNNPYFYPSVRSITAIEVDPANSAQAIVTLSVTHNLTVGQKVRFNIPEVQGSGTYFGMTQLTGLTGSIVAVGAADANGYTNTITVDIDVSGFTPFTFPITGLGTFTPAQIIPMGENTAIANQFNVNPFAGARNNTSVRGVVLQAGVNSPAGDVGDVIQWIAYKSFNQ